MKKEKKKKKIQEEKEKKSLIKYTSSARALDNRLNKLIEKNGEIEYPVQVSSPKPTVSTGLYCLDLILCGGYRSGRMYTHLGLSGAGKCLTQNSFILTDKGIIPIKNLIDTTKPEGFQDLKINIATIKGIQETTKGYYQSINETYKIKTKAGFEQEGTPEHQILTINKDGIYFKRHNELLLGDYIAISRGSETWAKTNYIFSEFIPKLYHTSKKYNYPKEMNKDLAWICGALIANGNCSTHNNSNSIKLSSYNKRNRKIFCRKVLKCFGYHIKKSSRKDLVISSQEICQFLRFIGLKWVLSAKKEIPYTILQSSRSVVLSFLKGYCNNDSGTDRGDILISSASKKLIRQLHLILLNFGIIGFLKKIYRTIKSKNKPVPYWYMNIFSDSIKFINLIPNWHKRYKVNTEKRKSFYNSELYPYINQWINKARKEVKQSQNGVVKLSDGTSKKLTLIATRQHKKNYLTSKSSIEKSGIINNYKLLNHPIADQLQELISSNYYWDQIIDIKHITKQKLVYDVTVTKENPTFIANGIINHNSSLLQEGIASAQNMGIRIFHFDNERGSSQNYMRKQGIIPNETYRLADGSRGYYYFAPETGDETYQMACNLLDTMPEVSEEEAKTNPPTNIFFFDSYESMIPKDLTVETNPLGARARMHSRYQPMIRPRLRRANACLVGTNQIRMKIMSFGDPMIDAGGLALQFYADAKTMIRRKREKKEGEQFISEVIIKCTKNKMADPFHECTNRLIIGKGFDKLFDRLTFLVMTGVFKIERGKYIIEGKTYPFATARKMMKDPKWVKLCKKLRIDQTTYDKFFGNTNSEW